MTSKRAPARGANRFPRLTSTATLLSLELTAAQSAALRVRSTAVTDAAPAWAALMARAPVPVHRSATRLPATPSLRMASASIQVSLTGRCTPGRRISFTPGPFPQPPGANQ